MYDPLVHIPDGFIDAPTSLGAAAVAAAGVGACVRRCNATLDERQVPMIGLTASFVFAGQMLNFPIAAGTSGHLLGGVLAAVLVGPWAGALAVTVVLVVQALMFADGGLTALGLNVLDMALIGALGGYAIFRLCGAWLPRTRSGLVVAAGVAAGLTPALAALAFSAQYALGGDGAVDLGTVVTSMLGVHLLIGIGEGVITAMTVSAVLAARPDLVDAARRLPRSPVPTIDDPALAR